MASGYVKPVQRGLESIRADKFPASFSENLVEVNHSREFLSKVVLIMQRGIDEADDTIFDDIKQLIDEIIILLGGGTLGEDANFADDASGLVTALVAWVGDVPIIGDIVRFIASIFGTVGSHGSRLGSIETKLAVGAAFSDNFNRNNGALGGPTAALQWKGGGEGQDIVISGSAAMVDKSGVFKASGRRWRQAPVKADSDTVSIDVVINDIDALEDGVYSEVVLRATDNFTAYASVRIYNNRIQIGYGTRSGNTWSWTQFPNAVNSNYRITKSMTLTVDGAFGATGKPTYTVLGDKASIVTYQDDDNLHTLGADRRWHGFTMETRAFPPFGDRFSAAFAAYYMRSQVEPTRLESIAQTAEQAQQTASGVSGTANQAALDAAKAAADALAAQQKADQAQQTATGVDQKATDAKTAAEQAAALADSVTGIAENADAKATNAQAVADTAYKNAQYWKDECVVASAGVQLGVNELIIGVVMDVPTGRTRIITDQHFALFQKPGTISIQTKVIGVDGVERVVHSLNIGANNTRASVSNLNIVVQDKERVFWNVTAISDINTTNVLQVALVGVLL